MKKHELPKGWKLERIEKVVFIDTVGIEPQDHSKKVFNYIALDNIESQSGRLIGFEPTKGKSIKSTKFKFDKRHILLGKLRPYLNKVLIPEFEGVCSTDILPLLPDQKNICREFLALCLKSPDFVEYTKAKMEGQKMPRLRTPDLKAFEIPLPPLPEQRRIVKRIEELTRRVEKANGFQKECLSEIENYLPSTIASVFADSHGKRWAVKKIKEVCQKPQYGFTESAVSEPVGPRFLRITDIQNGLVDWESVPFCRCREVDKFRLQTGDILFARTGATTGKSFLVRNPPEAIFASYLIRLQVKSQILPEFLFWYFQSSTYWKAVFSGIDEGNRPNMNGTKLANLKVSYPNDLSEQKKIVDYFEGLRKKTFELIRLQIEVEEELASLVPALLAKAFRGEL